MNSKQKNVSQKKNPLLVGAALAGLMFGVSTTAACSGNSTDAKAQHNGCNGPNGCKSQSGCNGPNGCKGHEQKPKDKN